MPSERERDEDDEARPEDREPSEAPDDSEAEESESTDDGRILTNAEAEAEAEGAVDDSPRNRAERRARARQQRRGQLPARDAGGQGAADRPGRRPPPRTMTGKSSADEVPPWARKSVEWLGRHRNTLLAGAAAVVVVVGGAVFWTLRSERNEAQAASLYSEAVEIENAQIRAADAPPDPPNAPPHHGPTFPDATARARAALDAFRRVSQRFPNAPVTSVARLGEAGELYDLGRYAEARPVYESLINSGANLAGQEGRAYEGLGFTLESLNDLPAALRRYEELARLNDGAYRDLAQFHQARVLVRQSQPARAKDTLHALIERLQRARPNEPLSGSASSSVLEQAKALLHDIDPEDPLGRRAEMPNDPDALIRMLEQRTGRRLRRGGPGGPGAPGGGGGGGEEPAGGP